MGLRVHELFHNWIKKIPTDNVLLDIGCGQNIFKHHYSHNIIGLDETWEADIYGHLEKNDLVKNFNHAFAINSIHFGSPGAVKRRVEYVMEQLPKCGQFWFSINNFDSFGELKSVDWSKYGKVKFLKLDSVDEDHTQQMIMTEYLNKILDPKEFDLENETHAVYKNTIEHDHLWGKLKVVLEKI